MEANVVVAAATAEKWTTINNKNEQYINKFIEVGWHVLHLFVVGVFKDYTPETARTDYV